MIGTIDGRSFAGDLNIRVGDEDLKDLEIRPELSAFLRARILVEDHAEDKVPLDLSAANIYAITDGAAPHDSYPQPRRQSDGSFILEELYSWEYRFVLSPLPSGSYIKSARIGQTDVMDTPLLVHAGEHLDDLIFTVSLKAGVVNGTVQDENANPVPGATVILQPDPRHRDRDPHECWRTADQNGGFNCDNLAPGKYRIAAWRTDPDSIPTGPQRSRCRAVRRLKYRKAAERRLLSSCRNNRRKIAPAHSVAAAARNAHAEPRRSRPCPDNWQAGTREYPIVPRINLLYF